MPKAARVLAALKRDGWVKSGKRDRLASWSRTTGVRHSPTMVRATWEIRNRGTSPTISATCWMSCGG